VPPAFRCFIETGVVVNGRPPHLVEGHDLKFSAFHRVKLSNDMTPWFDSSPGKPACRANDNRPRTRTPNLVAAAEALPAPPAQHKIHLVASLPFVPPPAPLSQILPHLARSCAHY